MSIQLNKVLSILESRVNEAAIIAADYKLGKAGKKVHVERKEIEEDEIDEMCGDNDHNVDFDRTAMVKEGLAPEYGVAGMKRPWGNRNIEHATKTHAEMVKIHNADAERSTRLGMTGLATRSRMIAKEYEALALKEPIEEATDETSWTAVQKQAAPKQKKSVKESEEITESSFEIGDIVWTNHPTQKFTAHTGKVTNIGRTMTTVKHTDGSTNTYPHASIAKDYSSLHKMTTAKHSERKT